MPPAAERVTVCSKQSFPTCAYPSLETLADGRLICVLSASGGKAGNKLMVAACFSEDHGRTWTPPTVIIDSKNEHDYDPNIIVVGSRVIVTSTTVPSDHHDFISTSRTVAVRSEDNGRTWSKPYEIDMGHRYTSGKINNGIVLRDGSVLFGYTYEPQLEHQEKLASEGDMIQRSGVLISRDRGKSWELGGEAVDDSLKIPERKAAIRGISEPAIAECSDGTVYMLARTGVEKLYESRSSDGGRTWSKPVPSPLVGHNAPAALTRFRGRRPGLLVVWNNSPKDRWPLCVAASFDDARTWTTPLEIAMTAGLQCSYPGCTQAADGTLIAAWQQQLADGGREILAARFPVEWLLASEDGVAGHRLKEPAGPGTSTRPAHKQD